MDEPQILTCPFDGGDAHVGTVTYSSRMVREQSWPQETFFHVTCATCCASNVGLVGHRSAADAIAKWNRRVPASVAPEVA